MAGGRACVLAFAVWGLAGGASAHALRHEVRIGEAVVVSLRFTDGEPFAFERYELFRGKGTDPVQSGLTDAQGRLVLLPGAAGTAEGWRLRAFSADGHGIDTALAFALHDNVAPAPPPAEPGWGRVALGAVLILGLGALAKRLLRGRRA